MTDKTEELDPKLAEALSTIEALKTSVQKLEGFNEVLKQENKDFKSAAQTAEQAREAAAAQAERASGDVAAIEKRITDKFQKEIDRLNGELTTRDNDLRAVRVDNEIARALAEGKVLDHMVGPLTYQFKAMSQYDKGVGSIEGKSVSEYIGEFLGTDAGSHYVRGSTTSGTNATGNTSTVVPTNHGYTRENFSSREGDFLKLAMTDPGQAKAIALDVGRPDLAADL